MNLPKTTTKLDGLVYEQGSDGGLYIYTETGVYFTDNKRITAYDPAEPEDADDMESNTTGWVRLGDALPHVATRGLEINYVINRIRVGTLGRGIWEHHLHCPGVPDYSETGQYPEDTFLEAKHDISSEAVILSGKKVSYRAGNEVHLTPGFHAAAGSRFHAFIHPCDRERNSFKSMISDEPDDGLVWSYDQVESGGDLRVFPNPNRGVFRVVTNPELAVIAMEVFDPMGRALPDRMHTQGMMLLCSMPDGTSAGVYAMRIGYNDGSTRHANISIEP